MTINDMGLDFRVALARARTGEDWVLRVPRQLKVMERVAPEGRLLRQIVRYLSVALPQWRIHTDTLIAYPLLPGTPGLELGDDGAPIWNVDASSTVFGASLGAFLAQLHSVPTDEVRTTGIPIRTPDQARKNWRDHIDIVAEEFTVAHHLLARWHGWLQDDGFWSTHSALIHGEVYPGHTLVDGDRATAVLDWTAAAVSDPARDLMFHQATASPAVFQYTLDRYVELGGQVWPRIAAHCAEMFSASPVDYGIYALETGDPAHLEAAAAQLNPPAE